MCFVFNFWGFQLVLDRKYWTISCSQLYPNLPPHSHKWGEKKKAVSGSLAREENSNPPYYLLCVREQRLFSWPFALPPPLLPWWWKSSSSHVPAAPGSEEELLWLLSVLSPLWISLRFDRDSLSFRKKKNVILASLQMCWFYRVQNYC